MAHFNPAIFITMSIPDLDQISIKIRMELVELKLEFNDFQRLSPHGVTMLGSLTDTTTLTLFQLSRHRLPGTRRQKTYPCIVVCLTYITFPLSSGLYLWILSTLCCWTWWNSCSMPSNFISSLLGLDLTLCKKRMFQRGQIEINPRRIQPAVS